MDDISKSGLDKVLVGALSFEEPEETIPQYSPYKLRPVSSVSQSFFLLSLSRSTEYLKSVEKDGEPSLPVNQAS